MLARRPYRSFPESPAPSLMTNEGVSGWNLIKLYRIVGTIPAGRKRAKSGTLIPTVDNGPIVAEMSKRLLISLAYHW